MKSLHLSSSRESEIIEELSQHLEDRWQELVAGGASEDEATKLALAGFREGDRLARLLAPLRQAHAPEPITLGASAGHLLGDLRQDLRYAVRTLRNQPVVALAAILTLALGIGANTAIFSLVHALLLRTLPVAAPEQLVLLARQSPTFTNQTVSYPLYKDLEAQNTELFDGLFATSGVSLVRATSVGNDTASLEVRQVYVTGNYFSGLGIKPAIGRLITADDDHTAGAHSVAVISHGYWQRAFGGESSALGRGVRINDVVYTVIGVTPPVFAGVEVGNPPDVYLPTAMQALATLLSRNGAWLRPIGRLRQGVSEPQAIERLNATLRQHLLDGAAAPQPRRGQPLAALDQTIQLTPASRGLSPLRQQMSRPLLLLMAMVSIVLVVACANVASLLLARATARKAEIATRLALGAGWGRLLKQFATESLVLTGGAAALGLSVAPLATRALRALLFPRGATDLAFRLDTNVLLFTGGIALVAGLICGLVPALYALRTDPAPALKASFGTLRASGAALRAGKLLVVAQTALAVVLVMGASLLVQTFQRLNSLDTGFVRDRVLLARVRVDAAGPTDAQRMAAYATVLDRTRALPGVRAAGLTTENVMSGGTRLDAVFTRGMVMPKRMQDLALSRVLQISPGFFEAMGMQIRNGRGFIDRDASAAPRVAIINEALARQHFPNVNPIGQRFGFDGPKTADQFEIVGVVNDVTYGNIRSERPSMFFLPLFQAADAPGSLTLVVHTQENPASLMTTIPRMVSETAPGLSVATLATQEQYVADALRQERALASLSSLFGIVALLLACLGIFAVINYTVTRRISEFGIRLAFGATRGDITRMVLGETGRLLLLAVVVGVPIALAASRYLTTLLFGVTPTDPVSIGLSLMVVAAIALLAGFIPAHRASRLDTVRALRYE